MSLAPDRPSAADVDLRSELEAERSMLDGLARIAPLLAAEIDSDALMQRLTDEATGIVGAQFGAFFYNVTNRSGESYMLYTLSGAPREAFERFGMPRNTAIFAPTFAGDGVVRSDDIKQDPRYGKSAPHYGMPAGHLPVVSYLAVPVRSRTGEVLGGLFFGHERRAVFGDRQERAAVALSAIAGPLLDNASLFKNLSASETALRDANTRYRLVAEASREGIWYWDIAANTVEWNDALLDAMGISRGEWPGTFQAWFSRVHPEDQELLSVALRDHLERREPYEVELFRLMHADGNYRWFRTVGKAEWDATGRPVRMAGSVRDVTDRKRAEDALRASEHRYAQILDSVGDLVFCKDDRSRVTYANAAACRYYGLPLAELRGMSDVPRKEIDFTLQHDADDRAVFETKKPLDRPEEPHTSPTGALQYFHTVKSPIFDEVGNVAELVGVSRDVTNRRRRLEMQRNLATATAVLNQSLDYEVMLRNVAQAMVPTAGDWCTIDTLEDGKLRRLAVAHRDPNKVQFAQDLERRYPTPVDAPHGTPSVLRTGKSEMANIPAELLESLAVDAEHLELIRQLDIRAYITVPMAAHGKVLAALSLVAEGQRTFDEHDLAFAEELGRRSGAAFENALLYQQVRELADTLERRVQERTAELQEANAELEAFSYSVSHDLRAPIRHVSGFADLLRVHAKDALDTKSLNYVSTIQQSATRMGALIDGLLAFSRLGRADLNKRPVLLEEMVRSIWRELEPDYAGRQVELRVKALPEVWADEQLLRIALTNLLSNAVKYTRQRGTAEIEVGGSTRGDEDIVWVKDNGAGFDMAYESKLFGVFQRLHAETEFEGTGIGLATTRRIISKHGGRVWAESSPNQGATFHVALPRGGGRR